ncbi:MAG: methylated-DNA--[protein]-cysteine S-methyltransferase [Defluviitaleaceae bacterium]|nr:methylated-DNA--[protein]-cysteine S-methyltransferase [Defluviitaleaceae bacterium]
MNPFYADIYKVVADIPTGFVMSYGQIARILGKPHNAREVGRAMGHCPADLPWHRVVMADGTITGTGGMREEVGRQRLEAEEVSFLLDGRVNMSISQHEI